MSAFTAKNKHPITNSKLYDFAKPFESIPRFIYRYVDASLPPEFHRSYTIDVLPDKINISIDSYGEVLSNKSLSIKTNTYQSFSTAILGLNIKIPEEVKSNGCTGGTMDELDIYYDKTRKVKGYVYHCKEDFGNLAGDVAEAVQLFKALIPDLKNRIEKTKK